MIVGDTADNVNYFKGRGESSLQRNTMRTAILNFNLLNGCYTCFLKKRYKSKAKEKYVECYNLLKLRT